VVSAATRALPARVALLSIGALAAAGLGWWRADRAREWETPAWDARAFVRLDADGDATAGGDARTSGDARASAVAPRTDLPIWVIPVNPACPHCVSDLASAVSARNRTRAPVRLIALIVDTAAPPAGRALMRLPADAIHWDKDGVWRGRWGHRVYGEALTFTPGGRYVRTIAAGSGLAGALPGPRLGVPPDDL
jgi:hypothetical protein